MAAKKRSTEPDPSKLTQDALREAALSYLNRYDATVHQLRQVLSRRIARHSGPGDAELAMPRAEAVLNRLVEARLLDDQRFAEGFTRAGRERGLSALKIKQKLTQRGVEQSLIEEALSLLDDRDELSELAAAQTFIRKKRLRARFDLEQPKEKQKALASLARQGFSFRTALAALAPESEDEF